MVKNHFTIFGDILYTRNDYTQGRTHTHQGRHLGGGELEGSMDPQGFIIPIFSL